MREGWVSNAVIGFVLAASAAALGYSGKQYWKALEPGTNWMEIDISSLVVLDAQVGEDPRIRYHRTIKRDFPATYIVSVFKFTDKADTLGTIYCTGFGGSNYKAGRKLPSNALTLSWLMNREAMPCQFAKGLYLVTLSYTIMPDSYLPKVVSIDSNYFLVPPSNEGTP